MSYSIKTELGPYAGADGKHKLRVLIICNRHKLRLPLPVKLMPDQLLNGQVCNHPQAVKINKLIRTEHNHCEGLLLDLLHQNSKPTLQQLKELFGNGPKKQVETLQELLQLMITEGSNTLSSGRIKHYKTMIGIMDAYLQPWPLDRFNSETLAGFHSYMVQKGYSANTIWSKFNILKAVRTQAVKRQLVNQDPFLLYKTPSYVQGIPVYITEQEMQQLHKLLTATGNQLYHQVGYYFLLACNAGFRISDLKKFDYRLRVQNNRIVLSTQKTGEIVSVKIHNRLLPVLEYCKQHRLTLTEQDCNIKIKELAKLAGIPKPLTMHSGRHSFAMMLAERNVPKEDAMKLMGITNPATIDVYYRITNARLDRVVDEKLNDYNDAV